MATISDVARAAKVSVSTVSYTLSGRRPISDGTRRRVLAAMEELGYRPHALARGLASRRSRILALLFPLSERGLGFTELEFVTGAADAALSHGYHLVLWPSELRDPDELSNLVRQSLVDGVVLMEVRQQDERVEALCRLGIPFAIIGRCADNMGLDSVDIDFETSFDDAVRYLANLGHLSVGYITHSQPEYESGYGPTVRSCEGFERAIRKHKLEGAYQLCASSAQAGADALQLLAATLPHLSALLVMNDRALPGIIQTLEDRGARIPEDVSLVTVVSSAHVGEMFHPPLTTFAPPSLELARLSVEMLVEKLESRSRRSRQSLISCQLVERGSAARARPASQELRRQISRN